MVTFEQETARRIVTASPNDGKIDSAATDPSDSLPIRPCFFTIQLTDKAFGFNALLGKAGNDILGR